jgi:hypothetical protein
MAAPDTNPTPHLRRRMAYRDAQLAARPAAPYCPCCWSDNVQVLADDNHEVLVCGDCDHNEVIS